MNSIFSHTVYLLKLHKLTENVRTKLVIWVKLNDGTRSTQYCGMDGERTTREEILTQDIILDMRFDNTWGSGLSFCPVPLSSAQHNTRLSQLDLDVGLYGLSQTTVMDSIKKTWKKFSYVSKSIGYERSAHHWFPAVTQTLRKENNTAAQLACRFDSQPVSL